MKIQIDIKSAVMGLAGGALLMLGVAAGTSSEEVGRYQLVSNVNNGGPGGSYSLLIDTETGRVWCAYSSPSGKTDDDFFQAKNGR